LLITAWATATDRLRRRSPLCSASSALLPRRSTPLADGLQVARRDTLRIAASRGPVDEPRHRSGSPSCASSLPPQQALAGRCRSARARCCRGLPSTNSCRFRRSDPRNSPERHTGVDQALHRQVELAAHEYCQPADQ
jgi:hypothetical protein